MALTDDEIAHLKGWTGRTQMVEELLAPNRVEAMAATLDRDRAPGTGDGLPPGWHWLFFNGAARQSELGSDGHPRRGGFLPPVSLPRRMWAGGRLTMTGALRVGEIARRESRIVSVEAKRGRSGDLVFVTVAHRISGGQGLVVEEEQDIVYRAPPAPDAPSPQPGQATGDPVWHREIRPDPVLLFRYSALTFNGHRIHYDQPYVTQVEGYAGLVVHGPLVATLLLDLVGREAPDRQLAHFSFRARSPLFDTAPFLVGGVPDGDRRTVRLWAEGPGRSVAMDARAEFASEA